MAELNWTREAQTWVKDIYDYIAADNPDAAARTVNGIYEEAQLLNGILKPDTKMRLKFAPSEYFFTVIIESPI